MKKSSRIFAITNLHVKFDKRRLQRFSQNNDKIQSKTLYQKAKNHNLNSEFEQVLEPYFYLGSYGKCIAVVIF